MTPETKTCLRCGQVKTVDLFTKDRNTCKACTVDRVRQWKLDNPDRKAELDRTGKRRRRSNPAYRATELAKDSKRRRDNNPRMRRDHESTCYRCGQAFTYEYRRKYRNVCDLCRKHDSDWRVFRLNGPDAAALRAKGQCTICGTTTPGGRFPNWQIDHNHTTGQVRDILCSRCNLSVGAMHDSPTLFDAAAAYLRTHERLPHLTLKRWDRVQPTLPAQRAKGRQPKSLRMGTTQTGRCDRCGESFDYQYKGRPRRVCDLCRQHDGDWKTFRLTGREAEALRRDAKCAICATDKPGGRFGNWHVDHDHATGKVRDVLCAPCNVVLGKFGDDPHLLTAAAAYLRRFTDQ